MSIRNSLTSFGGLALLSLIAATQSLSQPAALNPSVSHKITVDRFSVCTSQAEVENDIGIQNLITLLVQYDTNGIDVTSGSVMQSKLTQEYGEALLVPGINQYYQVFNDNTGTYDTICITESKVYVNRTTDPDPLVLTIRETVILP